MHTVAPDYVAAQGEQVSVGEPATPQQLETWFPGYTALAAQQLRSNLIAYAGQKATTVEAGGVTINLAPSGKPNFVFCATDATTVTKLQIASSMAQANPEYTQLFSFQNGPVVLNAAQIALAYVGITNFWTAVTNVLSAVIGAINTGTITTPGQVNNPPAPLMPWPSNS
jgi:hypothetical protein